MGRFAGQLLISGFLTIVACSLMLGSKHSKRFELADVFELEFVSDPQISPDGNTVIYVRNFFDVMTDKQYSNLWAIGFDGSGHRPLTTGLHQDSFPRWLPDQNRIVYISDCEGTPQLFCYWMDKGTSARLTNLTSRPRDLSVSPNGRLIAFSMFVPNEPESLAKIPKKPEKAEWARPPRLIDRLLYRSDGLGYLDDGYWHFFVLPVEGGTPRQVTSGDFHNGASMESSAPAEWTPDGESLLFSAFRNPKWELHPLESEIYEVSIRDGRIQQLTRRKGPDHTPSISPDATRIAYLGFDDKYQAYQLTRLYLMKRDGSESRLIDVDLARGIDESENSRVYWSQDGQGVFFKYHDQGNSKIAYCDLEGEVQTIAGDLGGTYLGRPYASGSFSVSPSGRFAYTISRPDHPADLAVGEMKTGKVLRITRLNQDLFDQMVLADVEDIWFQSSYDQRSIQGWLVKPPDFDPFRKYPLLLEIHGGPVANYGDRFSAEIQLYAAAGYLVLYTNPRGSTSYGEEFGNLIHHNYPGEDFDDLMSGVDAVIARGSVDPEKLFVTGGSGGGLLTCWVVGKTDRFRAAVSAKPVINWYSSELTSDIPSYATQYWFPGLPWEFTEQYMRRSPISLVGNVKTPTMLMTGEQDYRTPISEAEQYFSALKLRNVDSALVRFPEASHTISKRPSYMMAKVAYILGWFERYLEGAPDATEKYIPNSG